VGAPILEGYLDVKLALPSGDLAEQVILYPANPRSVYHMTKCLDQTLLAFYAKNERFRITALRGLTRRGAVPLGVEPVADDVTDPLAARALVQGADLLMQAAFAHAAGRYHGG